MKGSSGRYASSVIWVLCSHFGLCLQWKWNAGLMGIWPTEGHPLYFLTWLFPVSTLVLQSEKHLLDDHRERICMTLH
ncbi:hypothetical protein EV361DRAFT_917098 [Lentinula raphanica]|nr:hypothetical protein EV361DRAFT_917098 [Lentinula raphanica]